MSDKIEIKADTRLLQRVVANLVSANGYAIKVGILAGKTNRKDKTGDTNASIGVVHEFGSYIRNIPKRSFIKMPLEYKAKELAHRIKVIVNEKVLTGEGLMPAMKKIGVAAEAVIGDAFKTGGFGMWQALKPRTIARKGSDTILKETAQLSRSITSAVTKAGG